MTQITSLEDLGGRHTRGADFDSVGVSTRLRQMWVCDNGWGHSLSTGFRCIRSAFYYGRIQLQFHTASNTRRKLVLLGTHKLFVGVPT